MTFNRKIAFIALLLIACINSLAGAKGGDCVNILDTTINRKKVEIYFRPVSKYNCDTLNFKLYVSIDGKVDSICEAYYNWELNECPLICCYRQKEKRIEFSKLLPIRNNYFVFCLPMWLGSELLLIKYDPRTTKIMESKVRGESGFLFFRRDGVIALPEMRAYPRHKIKFYKIKNGRFDLLPFTLHEVELDKRCTFPLDDAAGGVGVHTFEQVYRRYRHLQ